MDDFSHIMQHLQEQVDQLLDDGQAEQALKLLNEAFTNQADDHRSRAAILDMRGVVYYTIDQLDHAADDFQKALGELEEGDYDHELAGSVHSSLGATYHAQGQKPEAVHHWQLAIRHYENNDPPLLVDVATIANNLGFLYKDSDDLDSAENCFIRALQILHSELGQYDELTATVYCNLGTLYHQAGFHDQSREMHQVALTTRSKMLGRAHPDTAQSLNNMALSMMASGDYQDAKDHFEAALKSFKALGAPYAEDYESTHHNYVELLHEMGEYEKADEVESETA